MSTAAQARAPMILRALGERAYVPVLEQMRSYTDSRDATSADELWLVGHPAVYTLGQAGRREHLLAPGAIPVLESDRGGQVTYHGPGQAIVYVLVDLRRAGLGVRHLVHSLEQGVIDLLGEVGIDAARRDRAPGVYVDGAKVAALGLRVRAGCTYHGLALNVTVDLEPFNRIDPCGYRGLRVTRTADLGVGWDVDQAGRRLAERLAERLGGHADWRPAGF